MLDQAVILAGGRGTRLGNLTSQTPKPLLPVGGRPFLEYVVWNLKRFGIGRFLFSVGYHSEQIIEHFGDGTRFGILIDYAIEEAPLNTGGALLFAANKLDDAFLVTNGDTLFDLNYLDVALLVQRNSTLVGMALRQVADTRQYGEVRLDGELIREFSEKAGGGPGLVNGGMYLMQRQVLKKIPPGSSSLERDLFPGLAANRQLAGKAYDGFFIDIGLPESLDQGHTIVPQWKKKSAVLLDRDGVLNIDHSYVHDEEGFVWVAGAPEAVKWLNDQGHVVIVVTNQAGIARGFYSEYDFLLFTKWINEQLRIRGAHIDATYYCPHHPSEGIGVYKKICDCRKPASGLIKRVIAEWNIDVQRSLLVGDKEIDLMAAGDSGLSAVLFKGGNLLDFIQSSMLEVATNNGQGKY